jgi:cellulose synthase/poly-beta-1,6-N-acetylglucosamine synthase-like glycosyltransferase
VSVVLVAHNEASRIAGRLQNLLESDYPPNRLEIIVVSDGSSDTTAGIAANAAGQHATVIMLPTRMGKAAGLNAGVAAAHGEVVVFADARQSFAPSTIKELSRALLDPCVGAVSGELEIADSHDGIGKGIDAYWRLERSLRRSEAAVDSCIGCTGAVYAIRRSVFTPLPEGTILDDVVIPMQIALRGLRIGFCSEARAFDPQALDAANETRRKRRTLAGNFQMLFRYPGWLLPWRNRLWWQLLAHKYLRLLGPLFLIAAAVANAALIAFPFYRVSAALQITFYACAVAGMFFRSRIFSIPAGFVFLNYNVIRAFGQYLGRSASAGWTAANASEPRADSRS